MIVGYHHAQITVPPGMSREVRAFFGEFLGLAELPLPPAMRGLGVIWFKIGDRELHVGEEPGVDRSATRAHLAYEVDNIRELRHRLITAGYELFEQPKIEPYDRFHIHDPFGNRVEFIQRIEA